MLFNSIDFFLFLIIVFTIYWILNRFNLKYQNFFILIASYVFYSWWDWRFLSLLFLSSILDFWIGIRLAKQQDILRRKLLLWSSILFNLGLLFFFKYYNFFVDSFVDAFSFFGKEIEPSFTLNIILPVGISFYTFQTMSYTIDVYRKKIGPTNDVISFLAFVSFFPQLVAGPIERASHLLPQFLRRRIFEYDKAVDGMRQMLWGLFKKVVIADNCGYFVNEAFMHIENLRGGILLFVAILFIIQLYCDFSGYSDIAIGTARLFGFNLTQNFSFPLFSENFKEIWKKWHISLTSWFKDYVYIPLGGSRNGKYRTILNLLITFTLVGFWHGADWTYIIFGFLNAIFLIVPLIFNVKKGNIEIKMKAYFFDNIKKASQIVVTITLFSLSVVFVRAENTGTALLYFKQMFQRPFFTWYKLIDDSDRLFVFPNLLIFVVIVFFIIEWIGRNDKYALEKITLKWNKLSRYLLYYSIVFLIFWMSGYKQDFYYFQF